MTDSLSDYWTACHAAVTAITTAKPTTAEQVVAILKDYDPQGPSSGDAFWSAANGDDHLDDLLFEAGWTYDWREASYYWQMSRSQGEDRQTITYVEGDVYANNPQRPL